jgi:hypothetical protein
MIEPPQNSGPSASPPGARTPTAAPPGLNGAIGAVVAIGVAMTVTTATLASTRVTLSVAGGAAVAAANLWVLGRIVMAFASTAQTHETESLATETVGQPAPTVDASLNRIAVGDTQPRSIAKSVVEETEEHTAPRGKVAAWSLLALLKMLILFGGAYQLMRIGLVVPLALVLGYSALPIGVTIAQVLGRLTAR